MAPLCTCNGKNAICKRCVCVRSGHPCVSCLPLRERRCINMLQHRQRPPDGSVKGRVRNNSDDMPLQGGYASVAPIADTDVNASS